MSQLLLKPNWVLELSTDDLRLVLRALGGRLDPEEVADARDLGDRLTWDRLRGTEREMDKLRKSLSWGQRIAGQLVGE